MKRVMLVAALVLSACDKEIPGLCKVDSDCAAAKAYCASLSLSGKGWRLPTSIELLSIVDAAKSGPAIDTTVFSLGASSAGGDTFWTSTPCAGQSGNAWHVSFVYGSSNYLATTNAKWVRCVR